MFDIRAIWQWSSNSPRPVWQRKRELLAGGCEQRKSWKKPIDREADFNLVRKLAIAFSTSAAILVLTVTSNSAPTTISSHVACDGRNIPYQITSPLGQRTLIILHGATGPRSPLCQEQVKYFASHGFRVLVPSYLAATNNSREPTQENYIRWARVVMCLTAADSGARFAGLLGHSLGGAIALLAGKQSRFAAIVVWSASPPEFSMSTPGAVSPTLFIVGAHDAFNPLENFNTLMSFLKANNVPASLHIYPEEGHIFSIPALKDAEQRSNLFFATLLPSSTH